MPAVLLGGRAGAAPAAAAHPIVLLAQVELEGQANAWVRDLPVRPGARVKVRLSYRNGSHATQRGTAVRLHVPAGTAVMGPPSITNALHPAGWPVAAGLVFHQGKAFGDYAPGANGFLTVLVAAPRGGLACGRNIVSVTGYVVVPHVGTAQTTARLDVVRYCPTSTTTVGSPG